MANEYYSHWAEGTEIYNHDLDNVPRNFCFALKHEIH